MTQASTLNESMARLANGERVAFEPVFRELWPVVLRFCGALLKQPSDAQDAAQQAMMKIFTRASEYDVTRPALPWALGIASWECRTLRKKQQRRKETALDADRAATSAQTDGDLEWRDLEQAAVHALGTLPELDREALRAAFWDDGSSAQGATQRKRKERALSRLRDAFRRLYGLD
jgi:RNA polymerase sigma-70 factor (ECF subfamily)